jgi:ubiquinone biosynthesis monooxygenase Coq7
MKPLPGTRTPEKRIARMLRVNLAGEYGAQRIYEGQLAVLKNHSCAPLLEHMKEQEMVHLKHFETWVVDHHVRPTALQPLWHVAGYALGVATGLLGEKAAMACTAAVEEVIDQHYEGQLKELGEQDPRLSALISACQEDEQAHRDIALEQGPAYPRLSSAIKGASRLAIWLSERI